MEKGGYENHAYFMLKSESNKRLEQNTILLDPLFWQALGKAKGWGTEPAATTVSGFPVQEWLMVWHRFIDHLAEGRDAESFLAELLSV